MSKKKRIVFVIMLLLIVGLGIIWCMILLNNNKLECEEEYNNCMIQKEKGMKVVCFPCEKSL